MHPEGVLDAVDVLGRREQADHVRPAEDQRLAVPPALRHAPTLRSHRRWISARSASSGTSRRSPGPTTRSPTRRSAATPTRTSTGGRSTTSCASWRRSASTSRRTPVGTLVARNRPQGEPVFGVGSHCDSNRNGGKYDGTMGVVTALEVCRLNAELGLDLPLQLISFLEEEGSGFGQMLLGSRIIAQRVTEEDLRERFRVARRRAQLLGARRGRGVRARALARVRARARRPDRLDRDAHRAGARAPGHRQPDRHRHRDRRLRARRRRRPRPRRPRRRDADGPPPRPDRCRWRRRSSSSSGWRATPARARSARSARSRSTRA